MVCGILILGTKQRIASGWFNPSPLVHIFIVQNVRIIPCFRHLYLMVMYLGYFDLLYKEVGLTMFHAM